MLREEDKGWRRETGKEDERTPAVALLFDEFELLDTTTADSSRLELVSRLEELCLPLTMVE